MFKFKKFGTRNNDHEEVEKFEERYLIFGSLEKAVEFQEKLEAQDCEYKVKLGNHSTGPWIKITYTGYKPF